MRAMILSAVLLLPLPRLTPALRAQAEERAVMAVVQQLFDGMRARDTAKMRATLHPDARLVSAGVKDSVPTVAIEPITGWLSGIPNARPGLLLDERIRNPVVRVDGGLASVWAEYTFYLGDKVNHCGVDTFHLVKTADGWRIIDLADTRRREGCAP
jgi:putative lumazine-binding protein